MATKRFRLAVLGGFELRSPTGAHVRLPTRKAEALLAYLALGADRSHPRDALATLLWTDAADRQARGSLRQTLSLVAKALGPAAGGAIHTEGRTVALRRGHLDVDALEFERCVKDGRPQTLARAAELYRGELLAGLGVREPAFEDWVVVERQRYRERAIDALGRLLAIQREAGDADGAIQTAIRLLAQDPLEESVHRVLMGLYAEQGRRADALRQYQACVDVLQREVGVDPEPETRQIYLGLVSGGRARDGARVGARRPAEQTPLVGRTAELAALHEAVKHTARHGCRVVAVLGEGGIGKTRLIEALLDRAEGLGAHAIVGRAYETEQVFAFGPWIEALRAAGVLSDAAVLTGLRPVSRAALARVVPELGEPEIALGGGPENAVRVFEAFAHVLAALAGRAPLLVVLEDLQWADEMSLRLLGFVGRRLERSPLAIVVSARAEELADAPMLRSVLDELDREARLVRLTVGPLTEPATGALVRALGGDVDDAAARQLARRVWEVSAGNPFVAVETLRAVRDGTAAAAVEATVPERVRQLVRRRVERLGEAARQLVTVAAVVGRDFEFAPAQRAAALDERTAAEALEELVRRGLLHGVGERFAFTHDRWRETIYADALPPTREVLHAAVGRELERLHAGQLERVYDQLAYHYAHSADDGRAVLYLTQFADHAARNYAFADAGQALEAALVRTHEPIERVQLALRRARVLSFLGRLGEALALLVAERGAVEDAHDPRLASRYHFFVGNTASLLGDRELATASARRALEEADRCHDGKTMARAHFVLALEAFWSGPFTEGVTHAQRSAFLLAPAGPNWWLGLAYWVLGFSHTLLGRFRAALEAERRAAAVGEALGNPRLESSAAWTTGGIHALAGESEPAIVACRRGLELSPDPLNTAIAKGWLGYALLVGEDADGAVAMLEAAVTAFERFRFRAHGWFAAWLAEAHLACGRVARARELAGLAVALARETRQAYGVGVAERVLGRCALVRGALDEATARFDAARTTFTTIEARFEVGRTLMVSAEVVRERGDEAGALATLKDARGIFEELDAQRYLERVDALAR
ncbi:MAG: AAA family ATPase [Candidatus Rokubacteria bacterium]|nr:AAA family ATPase [Candidatus Rokubacteria bacterium]